MAILDHNNVIFYHPLDEVNDTFISESWSGSGQFVNGQISGALAAIPGEDFEQGAMKTLESGTASMSIFHHGIQTINHSRFVFVYSSNEDGTARYKAKTGTVTTSGLNFNSETNIDSFDSLGSNDLIRMTKISDELFIAAWSVSGTIKACQIQVSGIEITKGDTVVVNSDGNPFTPDIINVDEERVLIAWGYFAGSFPNRQARTSVVEVSGSSLSVGSAVNIYTQTDTGAPFVALDKLEDEKFVCHWSEQNLERARSCIITTSGTTPTIHDIIVIASGFDPPITALRDKSPVMSFTNDRFVATYSRQDAVVAERGPYSQLCSVSGTTISKLGSGILWSESTGIPILALSKFSDDNILIHRGRITAAGAVLPTSLRSIMLDNDEITYGGIVESNLSVDQSVSLSILNENLILLGGADSEGEIQLQFAFINRSSNIQAVEDTNYASISGYDRLVLASWIQMLTVSKSQAFIERGYGVFLDKEFIDLYDVSSSGIVKWDSSGIVNLMDQINDGNKHLLVLDFENQGGNDWTLKSSLDGSGYTSHGTQTSGSLSIVDSDTSPLVGLDNHDPSGWVDELVLWAGDKTSFDEFSEQELSDLYDLGNVELLSMPFFTFINDNIVLNIEGTMVQQNNIDLFLSNKATNSSLNLFLKADPDTEFTTDSFLLDIQELIKKADYNPQLIGRFTADVASVTIEVWGITNSSNELLSLKDNVCHQIGSTLRWRWSTNNLPESKHMISHYLFKMTANNNETFLGEFIIKNSNVKISKHPNIGSSIRKI